MIISDVFTALSTDRASVMGRNRMIYGPDYNNGRSSQVIPV
jgi:hypothetical protein